MQQKVSEDLSEERGARAKEIQEFKENVSALEEVHREVQRAAQGDFKQEIQVHSTTLNP